MLSGLRLILKGNSPFYLQCLTPIHWRASQPRHFSPSPSSGCSAISPLGFLFPNWTDQLGSSRCLNRNSINHSKNFSNSMFLLKTLVTKTLVNRSVEIQLQKLILIPLLSVRKFQMKIFSSESDLNSTFDGSKSYTIQFFPSLSELPLMAI